MFEDTEREFYYEPGDEEKETIRRENLPIVWKEYLKYNNIWGLDDDLENFTSFLEDENSGASHLKTLNSNKLRAYIDEYKQRKGLPLDYSQTEPEEVISFIGKKKPLINPSFNLSMISLLFIINHGQIILKESKKGILRYQTFRCPVNELIRIILAAQECSSTGGVKLEKRLLRELLINKDWYELDERRWKELEEKFYSPYNAYQKGFTKSEGEFQFVKKSRGNLIVNKELCANSELYALSETKDMVGIYFCSNTTIRVPPLSTGVYNTEQLNPEYYRISGEDLILFYPKGMNLSECPVFAQFLMDFHIQHGLPEKPIFREQHVFDFSIGNYGKANRKRMVISLTTEALYTYLQSINTLSVIDNSCENHDWDYDEEYLKEQLEGFKREDLIDKIGKKRIADINRRIKELQKLRKTKKKGLRGGIKTKRKRKTMKKKRKTIKKRNKKNNEKKKIL